jgi:hypothetical protein
MADHRPVVIRTVGNEVDAAFVRAMLEAAGIPTTVSSGGSLNLPHVQFGTGIHIAVPEEAVSDALEVLEANGAGEEEEEEEEGYVDGVYEDGGDEYDDDEEGEDDEDEDEDDR